MRQHLIQKIDLGYSKRDRKAADPRDAGTQHQEEAEPQRNPRALVVQCVPGVEGEDYTE